MPMIIKYVLAIFCFLQVMPASAETVRVGSWNIQDLHHSEDFALRKFGSSFSSVRRNAKDFALITKYSTRFGRDETPADIVALQEIGTQAALKRIFPDDQYETFMSSRWKNDDALEGEGDVYTAIAIRRGRGISVVERQDLSALAVTHSDGNLVRSGTAVLLEVGGTKLWFLSVHLKSSCPTNKRPDKSKDDDCETLWKQAPILADWAAARRSEGVPFIIAGDFNRQFRALQNDGPILRVLNGNDVEETISSPGITLYPESDIRQCPTRKGKGTQPIDWIIVDSSLSPRFVKNSFWERRYDRDDVVSNKRGLSDHCPISVDLQF